MPLVDTPPDAVARIYAQSLFELCTEHGAQVGGGQTAEDTLAELEDIVEIARSNPDFNEFLASRILPASQRAESLERVLASRVSDRTRKFLLVLNAKDRLNHLLPVVAAFDKLVQDAFGRIEVDAYTAEKLDEATLSSLRDRLRAKLGREPVLRNYVDRSMIGGIKLQIGDQLVDASIATRLRKLKDQLAESGLSALRAKASRLMDEAADNGAA